METLMVKLYRFLRHHNALFWSLFIGIFLVAGFFASKIYFEQDVYNMIPEDEEINKMRDILKAQEKSNQIIISIHNPNIEQDELIEQAETLANIIFKKGAHATDSLSFQLIDFDESIVLDHVKRYLPIYLNEQDYAIIEQDLQSEHLINKLSSYQSLLWSPMGSMLASIIRDDPLNATALALQKFQTLDMGATFEQDHGYVFSNNGTSIHFFVTPLFSETDTEHIASLVNIVEEEVHLFEQEYGGVVEAFGAPIVATGNAVQMKKDTLLTLSLTVVGLSFLIFYIFRTLSAPFLLLLPVIYGAVVGLAGVYLIQGTLSIMALGAGAIILGVAVDFSVHFLSHYRYAENMETHIRQLVRPLTLGAFTTVAAFFAMRFAEAPILRDLGTFASLSLMGASLTTLIFLPQIISRFRFKLKEGKKDTFIDKIARWKPEKYPVLFWLVLLLTPVFYIFSKQVEFDSDLMKLNFMSQEVKEAQDHLNESSGWALNNLYVIAKEPTLEEALFQFKDLDLIIQEGTIKDKVEAFLNPALLFPSKAMQEQQILQWKEFWAHKDLEEIYQQVQSAAVTLGYDEQAFEGWKHTFHYPYQGFGEEAEVFLKELMPHALFEDKNESMVVAQIKVQPEHRLEVYEYLIENGVKVVDNQSFNESLLSKIHSDFDYVLGSASILVFVVLLIAYGRIELALITFIPLAITWVWILGIMAILGIPFNIVNIMIATLIFGLGDDYSIFMMDALQEEYTHGVNKLQSSRTGVYISVLTTILGLGTLIFAQHPALKSIAIISIIGLLCVLVISQIVQPVLFNVLIKNRAQQGKVPLTLWSLLKTLFYYSYFFIGSLLLFFLGLFLVAIPVLGKKRGKYLYHYSIFLLVRSLKWFTKDISVKYHGMEEVDWSQPKIIIANHSSFIDILLILAIHPKVTVMTNEWVWKSPFFGWIVRWADYWPASNEFSSIEKLEEKVAQGFSILIFPEGTRSYDGKIQEFKKGAFYLAQMLNLPLMPLYIDGAHLSIQKGDFLISKSLVEVFHISMVPEFLSTNRLNKKAMIAQKVFEDFSSIRYCERPNKFYLRLMHMAFTYKGPVLEWYVKIKVKKEQYYEQMNQVMPKEGLIYDLGAGYGLSSLMLSWTSPKRRVLAVDHDKIKLDTSSLVFTNFKSALSSPIAWLDKDLLEVNLQPCKGIVLQDTLHYFPLPEQWEILTKCFNALKPGGVIFFRDGMADLNGHEKSIAREQWSVKRLNFNKSQYELSFMTEQSLLEWGETYQATIEKIAFDPKTSHATYIILKGGTI